MALRDGRSGSMISPRNRRIDRRRFVAAMAVTLMGAPGAAFAHGEVGPVQPPQPPPDLDVELLDGSTISLRALLKGHVSAVQLIFTACQSICPIQGALFAEGARKLGDRVPDARWISLTLDPVHDEPAVLRAWQARWAGHPRWIAGRPDARRLEQLTSFLRSKAPGPDPHTAQDYFFNRGGELALRSIDFPSVSELLRLFELAASGR
jgi:protein SCO1/2